MSEIVTEQNLSSICKKLAANDKSMARIFDTYGTPPLWNREPTFATLIHIILEQQVSLASALAAFNKLKERVGEVSPENVLNLNDAEMKSCYFSRQKTGYARNLADAVISGSLDLARLESLSDDEAKTDLKKIKGIGDWTADIYLLMVMCRADIMPRGDLALHAAYRDLLKLDKRPKPDDFAKKAKKWKPYRSVAARLLWHYYLTNQNAK